MKEYLINKINNKDFNFSYHELIIIDDNNDLIKLIIDKLNEGRFTLNKDVYKLLIDNLGEFFRSPDDLIKYNVFATNILNYDIELLYDFDETLFRSAFKNSECLLEIKEIIYRNLCEKKYKEKELYPYELDVILEKKDYNLLKQFTKFDYSGLKDEQIKYYLKNITDICRKLNYLPRCFNGIVKDLKIDIDDKYKTVYYYEDNNNLHLFNTKMKELTNYISINDDNYDLYHLLINKDLDTSVKNGICLEAIKKGIFSYIVQLDDEFIEKNKDVIFNVLNDNNINISFTNYPGFINVFFTRHEDILEKLCEREVKGLLKYYINNHEICNKYKSHIIKLIESLKKEDFSEYLRLINSNDTEISNLNDGLDKPYIYIDQDIDKLINNNMIDELISVINNKSIKLSSFITVDVENLLLKAISKDERVLDALLKNYPDDLFKFNRYSKLINKVLEGNNIINIIKVLNLNIMEGDYTLINKKVYEKLKDYYKEFYQIDIKKMDILVDKFDLKILNKIRKIDKIKKLFELNIDDINKLIELFDVDDYNQTDAYAMYDIIKQKKYALENTKTVDIFTNINKNKFGKKEVDLLLSDVMDYYYSKNNVSDKVSYLLDLLKNKDTDINKLNQLKELCDFFVMKKREEYTKTYDINKECNIQYDFVLRSKIEKAVEYWMSIDDRMRWMIEDECLKEYNGFINQEDLDLVFKVFSGKRDEIPLEKQQDINKKIRPVKKIALKIGEDNLDVVDRTINSMSDTEKSRISKNYIYHDDSKDIFSLLSLIDYDKVKELLNNQELYDLFKEINKKYKLHLIPDYFNKLFHSINVSSSYDVIADIISYFSSIKELVDSNKTKNEKENMSLVDIKILDYLVCGEVIGNNQDCYKRALYKDDYYIYKADRGSYSSKTEPIKRLKRGLELTVENFKNSKMNIPPINKLYEVGVDKKKVKAIVGNNTNPINLTLGERTDACMRVYGHANSLLTFTCTNPKGFHIRFENEAGEFISRVTGYRLGNTVILNQLRSSLDNNITNADIIMALESVSKDIVNKSSDDKVKIENVIISDGIAMRESKKEKVNLSFVNFFDGVTPFYSDTAKQKANAIMLVGNPESINTSLYELNEYDRLVEDVNENLPKEELLHIINRCDLIKKILDDPNYDYEHSKSLIDSPDEILFGFANWEWYVYADKSGNIKSEVLIDNDTVKEQHKKYYDKIVEMVKKKKELNIMLDDMFDDDDKNTIKII